MKTLEENTSLILHWDTNEVFLNDQVFKPHVCRYDQWKEGSLHNTVVIELDARLDSSLDWELELRQAEEVISRGLYLIWKFDFGLETEKLSLTDPVAFETFKRTLGYFVKEYASLFEKNTLGVIFYEGSPAFHQRFANSPRTEENWKEWLQGKVGDSSKIDEKRAYRHFFADFFLSYLQMLSCKILDSWTIFLPLDLPKEEGVAEIFDFFSKERFEHFLLCLRGGEFAFPALRWFDGESRFGSLDCSIDQWTEISTAKVGLYFPSDAICKNQYSRFNKIIEQLDQVHVSFRVLYEKYAVEDWSELDYVIISSSFKESIQRMVFGFCAAGGTAVLDGPSLGAVQEISFKSFLEEMDRGRGI